MRQSKPTYYWDASLFLAWLMNESSKPGEMEGLAEVAWLVDRNQAIIVTSVMTKGEVWQSALPVNVRVMFADVFKRPNVVLVDLSDPISALGGVIREDYASRHAKLKLADAQHLATAIACKVTEFHTFDENDLIAKSGNVAGYKLIICKPKGIQGILQL